MYNNHIRILIHDEGNTKPCTTNGGADPNRPCVFPFMYNGITYQTCTDANRDGVLWCATKVNQDMSHLNWGTCNPDCSPGMYSL